MKRDDPRHGTYAGYQVHRREGKQACPACMAARAAYMRDHREQNLDWRTQRRARQRATQTLVELHRDEFQRLYVIERMKDREAKKS